jgi:hypothetical protein
MQGVKNSNFRRPQSVYFALAVGTGIHCVGACVIEKKAASYLDEPIKLLVLVIVRRLLITNKCSDKRCLIMSTACCTIPNLHARIAGPAMSKEDALYYFSKLKYMRDRIQHVERT